MNRGAARRALFHDDVDSLQFLDCIATAGEKAAVEIHAYCLMSNHFHLLVLSREGNISDFMRLLAGTYSRGFNRRRQSDGPIFRGRCRSIGIETDAHLIGASRYIHLNPVAAGLVIDPADWPWSSAAAFTGRSDSPRWLNTATVLDMVGGATPRTAYASYMAEGVDARTSRFYKDLEWD